MLHVYCFICSAFSEYNTEQFTPAKVGDDLVRLELYIIVVLLMLAESV